MKGLIILFLGALGLLATAGLLPWEHVIAIELFMIYVDLPDGGDDR